MPYADPDRIKETVKKSLLKWRLANPEKYREQVKRNNKAKLERLKAFAKEHGLTYRQAIQAMKKRQNKKDGAGIRNAYGQTTETYGAMLAAHDGRCALCRRVAPLKVDHYNVDGWKDLPRSEREKHVRGMLCNTCNLFIGHCQEDVDVILHVTQHIAVNIGAYLGRKR